MTLFCILLLAVYYIINQEDDSSFVEPWKFDKNKLTEDEKKAFEAISKEINEALKEKRKKGGHSSLSNHKLSSYTGDIDQKVITELRKCLIKAGWQGFNVRRFELGKNDENFKPWNEVNLF
jgi:hypothetical protein